jgi:hypothetical protein
MVLELIKLIQSKLLHFALKNGLTSKYFTLCSRKANEILRFVLQEDETKASVPEQPLPNVSGGNGNLRLAGDEGARVRPSWTVVL